MIPLKKYLLILLALSSSYWVKAQDDSAIEYSKFPLKIAIGNHAVGFPYQNSFSAFNPHLSVGTERGLNKNQKHHLFISSNLGFIRNKVIGNTITMDLDFGYRYTHVKGLFFETALGIGLLDQFHPRAIYKQNTTDGTYKKVSDKGTFASLIGFKMGIGYDFSKKSNRPFRIGLTHNFFIQTTYFDVKNFPIMPQSTTNILITYKFIKS